MYEALARLNKRGHDAAAGRAVGRAGAGDRDYAYVLQTGRTVLDGPAAAACRQPGRAAHLSRAGAGGLNGQAAAAASAASSAGSVSGRRTAPAAPRAAPAAASTRNAACDPRNRRRSRRASSRSWRRSDREPEQAEAGVEPVGPARDVGRDQRQQHAEDGAAHAVQRLDRHQQIGVRDQRQQNAPRRQRREAQFQHDPPPAQARLPPTHGEIDATTICGTTIDAAMMRLALVPTSRVASTPAIGSIAALEMWKKITQAPKTSSRRSRSSRQMPPRHRAVTDGDIDGAAARTPWIVRSAGARQQRSAVNTNTARRRPICRTPPSPPRRCRCPVPRTGRCGRAAHRAPPVRPAPG